MRSWSRVIHLNVHDPFIIFLDEPTTGLDPQARRTLWDIILRLKEKAALGTFLVIGFTLHNITERIGIAAPLLKSKPKIRTFVLLGTIAGAPAILGTWFGGFVFSPILGAVFLGIGAGAILQVIVVISKMLMDDYKKKNEL